ncbi:MAG: glycosyltransferase [Streptosporangiales bacterium]|nr:glycosyltransferase [Streptosporangiales bacterium]
MSTSTPRLSVGLPVYNGERYLGEALDALLGQTYRDFELIISDNASTDATRQICARYAERDDRIRYFRQPTNTGAAENHNFVFRQARGELFKWASHDDLYGRRLLEKCVAALDDDPQVVLAHAWQALIGAEGEVLEQIDYPLATDAPTAAERFASMLFTVGGDDFYGVIRSDVLRRTRLQESFHHADRVIVADLALQGRFHQVPEVLYFRRDHPGRAERAQPSMRARCANLDPRRANRIRHPRARLLAEYIWGFVAAVRRAPITPPERRRCYRQLARWLTDRAIPARSRRGAPTRMEDRHVGTVAERPAVRAFADIAGQAGGS